MDKCSVTENFSFAEKVPEQAPRVVIQPRTALNGSMYIEFLSTMLLRHSFTSWFLCSELFLIDWTMMKLIFSSQAEKWSIVSFFTSSNLNPRLKPKQRIACSSISLGSSCIALLYVAVLANQNYAACAKTYSAVIRRELRVIEPYLLRSIVWAPRSESVS